MNNKKTKKTEATAIKGKIIANDFKKVAYQNNSRSENLNKQVESKYFQSLF